MVTRTFVDPKHDEFLPVGLARSASKHESNDLLAPPAAAVLVAMQNEEARNQPGVTVGEGAVLTLGSVASTDLAAGGIYTGNPATLTKMRSVETETAR